MGELSIADPKAVVPELARAAEPAGGLLEQNAGLQPLKFLVPERWGGA